MTGRRNQIYERVWEGMDLFGWKQIVYRIDFGHRYIHWSLYLNPNPITTITVKELRKEKVE